MCCAVVRVAVKKRVLSFFFRLPYICISSTGWQSWQNSDDARMKGEGLNERGRGRLMFTIRNRLRWKAPSLFLFSIFFSFVSSWGSVGCGSFLFTFHLYESGFS